MSGIVPGGTITVSTQTLLNQAIKELNQETSAGSYTIEITGTITEGDAGQPAGLYAIDLLNGVTLAIDGGGTLNGAGTNGGIAVLGGKVSISDLTIEDTVAQGGNGDSSAGGGAGLGGGLFVGSGANVAITNVQFTGDVAKGGMGGTGGGGGGGGNSSLIYAPLGNAGATGSAGTDGQDAQTPFTYGGNGGPGGRGGAGGYGADGGSGGDGGKGGGGAAGTAAANYTGGHAGPGGTGAPGGSGGPGGKGGDGGGGGDGGDGGDGTKPPATWPTYAGAPWQGARGGEGAKGGLGGYGGGGGAGGDGGGGGKGGDAPAANTAVAGKPGATGGPGGKGSTGGAGGFGAGGGGGGKGGDGGDGGDGGMGGKGGKTHARTGGIRSAGDQPAPRGFSAPSGVGAQGTVTTFYPPGVGGDGGTGAAGGSGGHGGVGGFGGGGGGGGVGGDGGKGGDGGAGGTPGSSGYPTAAAGVDGRSGASGAGGTGAGGGFGGGAGAGANGGLSGAGGGGLGAGGDIFVANGGILVVDGGYMAGTATGGAAGGSGATAGDGNGNSIFLQGNEAITLAASTSGPLYVYQDISDEAAHGGTGSGSVVIAGTGAVNFDSTNDYSGGTTIDSGNLVLNVASAVGSGAIDFGNDGSPATVTFNLPDAPTNIIEGFSADDQLFIYGIAATASSYTNGVLSLSGEDLGNPVSLNLNIEGDYTTDEFSTIVNSAATNTYTELFVDTPPPPTVFTFNGGTASFTTADAWTNNLGGTGSPGTGAAAVFSNGGTLTGTGTVADINLSSNTSFEGDFTTGSLFAEGGTLNVSSGTLHAATITLGQDAGSAGGLSLIGTGTSLTTSGTVQVGGSGSGLLTLDAGAIGGVGGGIVLGGLDQGSGTLVLTGDGNNSLTTELSDASSIIIGDAASSVASELDVTNQVSLTSGTAVIGADSGSDGMATIAAVPNLQATSGFSPIWTINGNLIDGQSGAGSLDIQGLDYPALYVQQTLSASGFVDIGEFAGATGMVTLATGELEAHGDLIIGDQGSGTLNESGSGYVGSARDIDIGLNTGGVGLVTLNGGAIEPNKALIVGGAGGGTLNLSNNANAFATDAEVGANAGGSGSVSLDQSGLTAENIIVGETGTGTISLTDNARIETDGGVGGTAIIVGGAGTGLLDVQSNSEIITENSVDVGESASGSGTIEINGGAILNAASLYSDNTHFAGALIAGDAGTGAVTISGGGSASFGGLSLLGNQPDSSGSLDVASGGQANFSAFLNLGFDLGAQGAATVTGTGSFLEVTGGLNIGDGGGGTLDILDGGQVSIAAGSGANYAALGGGSGASGTLLLDGTGSELNVASDLSAGVAGSGDITISNDALLNDAGALFTGFAAGAGANISVLSGGSLIAGAAFDLANAAGANATLTIGQSAYVSTPTLNIGSGGTADATVEDGGTLSAATIAVSAGGTLGVTTGAVVDATSITLTGGSLSGDGTLAAAITNTSGTIAVDSGTLDLSGATLTNDGVLDVSGAVLVIQGALSGAGTILVQQTGSLQVDGAVSAGQQIMIDPSSVEIGDAAGFAGTLTLSGGDMVLVDGANGGSYLNGVVTTTENGTTIGTIAVSGVSANDLSFQTSNGDLLIDDTAPACYAAGTRIRTVAGDRAVEDLSPGDLIVTRSGEARPVRWIGYRNIDCQRHATPELVQPVRIRTGAFGDGLPNRDLLVSPDHAMLIDDMLISVGLLINGGSIVSDRNRRKITYFHIELDSHDILLAEGLPAESYLDTGNRAMFENSGLPVRLHPDFGEGQRRRECRSRFPFVDDPVRVEKVWRALAERSAALGWRLPTPPVTVDEPDLHLLVGRRRLRPVWSNDGRVVFVVPAGEAPVRLVSRAACPRDLRPWLNDSRRLGVMVRRMSLRRGQVVHEIGMDDPALGHGWWQVEWHAGWPCRWTDGEAVLPITGPGLFEVELAGAMRYEEDSDRKVEGRASGVS